MKTTKMLAILVLALGLMVCQARVSKAAPMSTAFTYQGRLIDANDTADGLYDFQFKLYDSNVAGTQQGNAVDINDLDVIDGHFIVELYFGPDIFTGSARWLETTVAQSDGSDPCTLTPRVEVTPTPYALYAKTAGADNDWMVSGNDMYSIPSGNVGIGTTVPATKLHVDGGDFRVDGRIHSELTSIANTWYRAAFYQPTAARGSAIFLLAADSGNTSTDGAQISLTNGASPRLELRNRENGDITFLPNNSERMRIQSGGNVGIGDATPSEKLDVAGHINSSESYKLDGQTVLANTGTNNIFVGKDAGVSVTTGYDNSAMGFRAINQNTTGRYNSAMGNYALYSNTTGVGNSAMGREALYANTTGNLNSAMGDQALQWNTSGYYNSAMGIRALWYNTKGNYNTAMGCKANFFNEEGSRNTIIGFEAGRGTSEHNKSGNVFVGYQAGYYETGDNKLYIANSNTSTPLIYGDFATNRIGINRVPTANTFEVGGNASKAVAGSWLANSDVRIKADIQTVTNALETLDKVRLVSFKYTDDYQAKHPSIEKRRYLNIIAQEFRQVFPEYVKSSKEKLTNGEEILQVDSYPLTIYSAAAVQELHAIAKAKDAEIAGLKERISRIEAVLAKLAREQEGGQL